MGLDCKAMNWRLKVFSHAHNLPLMKKILFAAVLFVATTINAQELKFGAKAGVNLATLSDDSPIDISGRTGFHLGFITEIRFSEKFSFQPEVLYSSQGAKTELSVTGLGSSEEDIKLDYVNIPLIAKYYFIPGLALEVGPQVGLLVKAEREFKNDFTGELVSGTEDIEEDTKSMDYGVAAGLSYELPWGVFLSGRYNFGLSKVVEDFNDPRDFRKYLEWKNRVIQLSVGYKF